MLSRVAIRTFAAAAVAAGLACGHPPAGRDCSTQADCPADAHCRSGLCVADLPPVAVVTPPAAPVSNATLKFAAHGSHDPDPEDAVAGWAWEVRPSAAVAPDCEPLASAGRDQPELTVIFPCGGSFDVSLVVSDSLGMASPPATVRVAVATSADPPQVVAGADRAVDHRCEGTPPVCTPWDGASAAVALSASASGPLGVSFRYAWTATPPPELAGQPAPRIRFLPGPDAPAPQVLLETDGTAIAGRWTFAVVATDSRGLSAVARQRLDVGNRPPEIAGGGALSVPHAFDAAAGAFTASGTTPPATWADPDGDPVTSLGFAWLHEGDGGAPFSGADLGDRATFALAVPYARPGDADRLLGPGVSRRVELTVSDANGARATARWTVEVANRPPRLADPVAAASVDHAFDATAGRYRARAPLSAWVDDDGDPLVLSIAGDAGCGEASLAEGRAWVGCEQAWAGTPDAGSFARPRDLAASVRDPWAEGPPQATRLDIRNRAPRLLAASALLPAACRLSLTCCDDAPGAPCRVPDAVVAPSAGSAALLVDDDGDPLAVGLAGDACLSAAAPPAQPCPAAGCELGLSLCGGPLQCGAFQPAGVLSVTASDGLASVAGTVSVEAACR